MGQPQAKILTVTLNPALDLSTSTHAVRAGPKLRCDQPRFDPGGGGINISRAIEILGGTTLAMVALGGEQGKRLAQLLLRDGVVSTPLEAPGETRLSFSVTDRGTGEQFRFVLPGPVWSPALIETAIAAIAKAADKDGFVAISGSQPPGFSEDFIGQIRAALPTTTKLVADTSHDALKALATAELGTLDVLRMDGEEAATIANTPLVSRQDSADFAQALVRRGVAKQVVIARGADGSVLATASDRWFCEAAKVPIKSKIGAGDSFVAGFVLALARNQTEVEALALGVAAASAAVMTPATELCRRTDTEALLNMCEVVAI